MKLEKDLASSYWQRQVQHGNCLIHQKATSFQKTRNTEASVSAFANGRCRSTGLHLLRSKYWRRWFSERLYTIQWSTFWQAPLNLWCLCFLWDMHIAHWASNNWCGRRLDNSRLLCRCKYKNPEYIKFVGNSTNVTWKMSCKWTSAGSSSLLPGQGARHLLRGELCLWKTCDRSFFLLCCNLNLLSLECQNHFQSGIQGLAGIISKRASKCVLFLQTLMYSLACVGCSTDGTSDYIEFLTKPNEAWSCRLPVLGKKLDTVWQNAMSSSQSPSNLHSNQ